MIETRPDWCVSRQRAWGVPIAVFVHKATGEVLRDPEVVERIARAFEAEGADAWWTARPAGVPGQRLCRRRLREGRRHPRRLVRQRLHPRHRAGAAPRAAMAGLALSRGLRPASRLVPFLAAGELRHARPRSLRGRADPRLRRRRRRPQDVEVPGQRRLAHRPDEDPRCRHPAPVGGQRRLHRGSAHRQGDPGRDRRHLSPPAQHAALSPGQPRRLHRGRAAAARRRCPSSSAGSCTGWPSSTSRCAPATASSTIPRLYGAAARVLRQRPVGLLLRRAQGRALLRRRRTACAAAPRAPCSTSCSAASPPGWRRCWCSRPRRPGSPASPTRRSVHLRVFPDVPADWRDPALGARWERIREVRRVVTGALELERKEKRIGASLQAAPDGLSGRGRPRAAGRASIWPSSRSPAASRCADGPAPAGAFTLEDVPGVAVVPGAGRGREMRCAAGRSCRRWRHRPSICAGAAPTPSPPRGRPEPACASCIGRPCWRWRVLVAGPGHQMGWCWPSLDPLPGRSLVTAVLQPGPGLEPRRQLRHARRVWATTGPGC